MKSCLHKKRATKPNHIIQKKRAITKTSGKKNREQSNRITSPSSNTMISTKTSEKKQRAIKQIHIIIIKQNHSKRIISTLFAKRWCSALSPKDQSKRIIIIKAIQHNHHEKQKTPPSRLPKRPCSETQFFFSSFLGKTHRPQKCWMHPAHFVLDAHFGAHLEHTLCWMTSV